VGGESTKDGPRSHCMEPHEKNRKMLAWGRVCVAGEREPASGTNLAEMRYKTLGRGVGPEKKHLEKKKKGRWGLGELRGKDSRNCLWHLVRDPR